MTEHATKGLPSLCAVVFDQVRGEWCRREATTFVWSSEGKRVHYCEVHGRPRGARDLDSTETRTPVPTPTPTTESLQIDEEKLR